MDGETEGFVEDWSEDDYVGDPLVPAGTYYAKITELHIDRAVGFLKISAELEDNEGKLVQIDKDGALAEIDGTSVNGSSVEHMLWLPKEGDDEARTASGKFTKKQWKVKQLKEVGDSLGVSFIPSSALLEVVEGKDLVGLGVDVKVRLEEHPAGTWRARIQNFKIA